MKLLIHNSAVIKFDTAAERDEWIRLIGQVRQCLMFNGIAGFHADRIQHFKNSQKK